MMDLDIPILGGNVSLLDVFNRVVKATLERNLTEGFDLDGSMVHAVPGEHVNVPHDPNIESIFLQRNRQTGGQSYPLTGRPLIFTEKLMPNAKILKGTEHGSVWHLPDGRNIFRIGDPEVIKHVIKKFEETRKAYKLLKDVQIEEHKTVSGTIGFTNIINPHGLPEIDEEALKKMDEIRVRIVETLSNTIEFLGISDLQVVPTVTPTNAVVELLFEGACKAESVKYAREQGLLRRASTNSFVGDSNGDRSVMELIASEPGGLPIGVGPKAPLCSHIVFKAPENLRAFYGRVIEEVDERRKALRPLEQTSTVPTNSP